MRNYFQILIIAIISACSFAVPVYDDLWDVSNGITITASSDIESGISDMFGANNGLIEPGNTLFGEAECYGIHWIRWETTKVVQLLSFKLYADGNNDRSFSYFGLFVQNEEGNYDLFYAEDIAVPYLNSSGEDNLVSSWVFEEPIEGKVFGAAFMQCGSFGPRIIELDGFGINHTPEPAMVSLILGGLVLCRAFSKKLI